MPFNGSAAMTVKYALGYFARQAYDVPLCRREILCSNYEEARRVRFKRKAFLISISITNDMLAWLINLILLLIRLSEELMRYADFFNPRRL